jgi:hypothetical protein
MSIIFNPKQLDTFQDDISKKVGFPMIIEEFFNHNGVIFKVNRLLQSIPDSYHPGICPR